MSRNFRLHLVAVLILLGSALAGHSYAAGAPGVKLVIVKAEYGDLDSDKTLDVTAKVAAMVKDNCLDVEVSNATLGAPPAGSGPSKLKVGYTIDGLYRSKTAEQGQTLDISTRLVIRKAVYGNLPKGDQEDVTDQVAGLVRHNSLTVEANNDNFGDPAGGVVKKLRVDYTLDGVEKSQTVEENQTLKIAPPAAGK